jgi:hypothetical protein
VAVREITSLVCDLHGGEEAAGAAPVWLGIGGQLYRVDACPGCEARLREVLSPFIGYARPARALPAWLTGLDPAAGPAVRGPAAGFVRVM